MTNRFIPNKQGMAMNLTLIIIAIIVGILFIAIGFKLIGIFP